LGCGTDTDSGSLTVEVCAGLATGKGDFACTAAVAGTEVVVGAVRTTVLGSFFSFSASTSSFL